MISLFELLYLIAREVRNTSVPPTDPATTPRTIGDVLNLKKAAAVALAARTAEAATASKAVADAQAADAGANTMVRENLKVPAYLQDAQGIEVYLPDGSEFGFHAIRPLDAANTPLDNLPPEPGPTPEPAPVIPEPVIPEPAPPAA
jgi:hypothetical protein